METCEVNPVIYPATTATFGLYGDIDPEAVTAQIGIRPTMSFARGSLNPKGIPRRSGLWIVKVCGARGTPPLSVLQQLLEVISPAKEAIRELGEHYESYITAYLYTETEDDINFIEIPPETLHQLGQFEIPFLVHIS